MISSINKLNVSVIVSRPWHASGCYCSSKPQFRIPDKGNLEASKTLSQFHSLYWGEIKSETEVCKTVSANWTTLEILKK